MEKRKFAISYMAGVMNMLFELMKTLKTLLSIDLADQATKDVSLSIAEAILSESMELYERTQSFFELPKDAQDTIQ